MSTYNPLEYSNNYSMASGSLWNYYRTEINDDPNENVNNRINNNKIITSRSFEYKTKLIWSTPNDNNTFDAEVVVQLIYLNNFWRSLDLPLINCEIEFDLLWSKECIISEISIIPRIPGDEDVHLPVQEMLAILLQHFKLIMLNFMFQLAVSKHDNIKFLLLNFSASKTAATFQTNNVQLYVPVGFV